MSKFDEKIAFYTGVMNMLGWSYEDDLFEKINSELGSSTFKCNVTSVSTSCLGKIETVKQNFLIKKLGSDGSVYLRNTIVEVAQTTGQTIRVKCRAFLLSLGERIRTRIKNLISCLSLSVCLIC